MEAERKKIAELSSDSFASDMSESENNDVIIKFVPQSIGELLNKSIDKLDEQSDASPSTSNKKS